MLYIGFMKWHTAFTREDAMVTNNKVIIPPGAHLPNRDMASRHSTGYSLLIGQELVLEHEYAGEVRHIR